MLYFPNRSLEGQMGFVRRLSLGGYAVCDAVSVYGGLAYPDYRPGLLFSLAVFLALMIFVIVADEIINAVKDSAKKD